MNSYILAAKRALRSVGFLLLLFVTAVAIFAAPFIGREEASPPAGVVDMDESEISRKVVKQLTDSDFILCEDEEKLKSAIAAQTLNCGIILPEGFGERLREGALFESVRFITSPTSFVPEIYSNSAAAAIFSVRAPYVTAEALEHTGISEDEIALVYDELTANGYLFRFDVIVEDARVPRENERAWTYTVAAGGLLLFALLVYGSGEVVTRDCGALVRRIGVRKTLWHMLVPSMTVRALFAMLTVCIALILATVLGGEAFCTGLILPMCAYALMLSAFAMLLSAIFKKASHIQTFSCFILLLSLVLCPIYIDAALFFPGVSIIRYAVPVWWAWLATEHAVWCIAAALIAFVLSSWLISLRWRHRIPDSPMERV